MHVVEKHLYKVNFLLLTNLSFVLRGLIRRGRVFIVGLCLSSEEHVSLSASSQFLFTLQLLLCFHPACLLTRCFCVWICVLVLQFLLFGEL